MKKRRVDASRERRLLTALITSSPFVARAASVLDPELIEADHFRTLTEWCIAHHKEYGEAPGEHIEDYYHSWSEDNDNTELVDSVHDFLESLSEDYDSGKDVNIPYLLDELSAFITKRRIKKLQDNLSYHMMKGEQGEAEKTITQYSLVEVSHTSYCAPLNAELAWTDAFSKPMEPLIEFSGAAGRFFNSAMVRDSLIAIQAPEKRGKTFWCIEFAVRALRARKKVAFFGVGDLSQAQFMMRLGVRFSGRPLRDRDCGIIKVPSKIIKDPGEPMGYTVQYKEIKKEHAVTQRSAKRGIRKFKRGCGISERTPYFMVSTHANSSINVSGIESVLDQWKLEKGFIPDVIVIDYADILASEDRRILGRDSVNDTWKALRRLSQERHCLVIAPTQADAQSYDSRLQTMKNFSEDKRKMAHVTGMMALNQSDPEKEMQGMRLNWIVLREAGFAVSRQLYVGTCFALGKAMCCSSL
jgi:hypothetical protein